MPVPGPMSRTIPLAVRRRGGIRSDEPLVFRPGWKVSVSVSVSVSDTVAGGAAFGAGAGEITFSEWHTIIIIIKIWI